MEKYGREWFKERALSSLTKIEDRLWDYSDSLLLYTPSGADAYEEAQNTDTPYFRLVTGPEHEYLKSVAKDIVSLLPDNFDFIDLGPGTEHKEEYFFDEMKKQGKTFTYIPVDISDHFLTVAEKFAADQGVKVEKIKSSFEELPTILGRADKTRFVSLGLTISNFNFQEGVGLLRKIVGSEGFIFINTQIKERVDMSELQQIYKEVAPKICEGKIELLDLKPWIDTSSTEVDHDLKLTLSIKNTNPTLEKIGVQNGDTLLIFQSLRYTKESLNDQLILTGLSFVTFDTGNSFIASLIKT